MAEAMSLTKAKANNILAMYITDVPKHATFIVSSPSVVKSVRVVKSV